MTLIYTLNSFNVLSDSLFSAKVCNFVIIEPSNYPNLNCVTFILGRYVLGGGRGKGGVKI